MTEIIPTNQETSKTFNFMGLSLDVLTISGDVWFVAKDVCAALELNDVNKAIKGLDSEDRLIRTMFLSGQNRSVSIINESGLYQLTFRSRKKKAKEFKKFVTGTILPSIRKTGSYQAPQELTKLESYKLLVKHEEEKLVLEAKLEKAQPALEFTAQVKNSSQTNTCRNAAKLINQRPNKYCRWLLEEGYTYDSSQGRTVKQQYIDMGILEVKKVQDRNDDSKFRNQIFVTNKGLAYFSKKLMGVEL